MACYDPAHPVHHRHRRSRCRRPRCWCSPGWSHRSAPTLLDVMLSLSLALSIMVLVVSASNRSALDFSAFPTVLLIATLLRLSLNVASTRLILLHGDLGPGAAGSVIEAFGRVIVGDNYAVGIVVFVVLAIINFAVVTKGASRVAEVAARFTLDAMPGKQMAIDADLNSGSIGEEEARRRRRDLGREARLLRRDGRYRQVRARRRDCRDHDHGDQPGRGTVRRRDRARTLGRSMRCTPTPFSPSATDSPRRFRRC